MSTRKPKANPKGWLSEGQMQELATLITDYTQAAINDSWKGGGDPADAPVIDLELKLARVKLQRFLDKLVST